MPGLHSDNTKLLGFYADRELIRLVDEERKGEARSKFMRDAVIEYMQRRGVHVPDEYRSAPDRAGKGGPRKYREGGTPPSVMNEAPAGVVVPKAATVANLEGALKRGAETADPTPPPSAAVPDVNSSEPSVMEEVLRQAVHDAEHPGVIYGKTRKAGYPSDRTASRAEDARRSPSGRRSAPGRAPK